MKSHLVVLSEYHKIKSFDFDDITPEWFLQFQSFLTTAKEYKHNTVSKFINEIKGYLNAALDEGITTNRAYKRYSLTREPVFNVYCNIDQLERLYHFDPQKKSLERTKDDFFNRCFNRATFFGWIRAKFGPGNKPRGARNVCNPYQKNQSKRRTFLYIRL